jgi:hypothetical protein
MSINTVSGPAGPNDIGQLVQRLVSAADRNKDGNLSSSEFGSFLTNLLGGVAKRAPDLKGTQVGSAATADAADPPAADRSSVFNIGADACNGFDGVTYAGFSPQDHQGADLFDPMKAKYALQQYMVENGALTRGVEGNAAAIASGLNARYGAAYGNPNFFKAVDAETILMPDGQYVHAAPNGYGMKAGTFNPLNMSEVFWGAVNA